ncbi:UDP-N-acetylmuramoyl-L-alanine--D-glutamate ligase [Oceanivirga salmonicida]|uniref:UDP-N-acetylmuramoyl-L-alanine--D-glutamate ligase n=1 Tax=Oceanivirga salmonicida TaxID=1769291 RepID=UPI0008370153|nr:UDP-N-acetylmuramoyl-L-alanine--D-glutamate ligase [Oceanivirga salmonicida]
MKYVVFGLGISGIGAMKLLENKKLEYIVVDDKNGIKSMDAISMTNKDDIVIKSPGIAWTNPYLKYCVNNNIKVISEIDFALDYMNKDTKIVAVTGTNGKTTVCTKTYELLKYAGFKVALGGNEGHSFSEIILNDNTNDYVVLELSSYQLENNPKIKPYIALITNLTPDHLSRYLNVDDYYATKFNIFNNQDENDYMIINKDDELFEKLVSKELKAKKVYIKNNENALYFENELIISKENTSLKGEHNVQNMLNIIAIAKIIGIKNETISSFLSGTKPLEHRVENFLKKGKVTFINDSKGTNVESSLVALETFKNKKVYLICGGQDKKIDNSLFFQKICSENIFCMLIGENSNLYVSYFKNVGYTKYIETKNLENTIIYLKKHLDFDSETYVLLSPATASFDQFKSFEHRGKVFKDLVLNTFGGNNG